MTASDIMKKFWFFKPDPKLQNNLMYFGFDCGEGWYPLIEELCCKIEKVLNNAGIKDIEEFEVFQVKEKFGSLRFYHNSLNKEIDDLVEEYEEKSATTCEVCGEKGTLFKSHGWWMTRCEKHTPKD
jgi:hypothetical protein